MAHTNQTPNYGLSEFVGTDKPAWLVDYNGDMEKIDLGLKAAKDVADAAKEEADQGATDIAAVTITANSADAKASGAVSDLADAYDSTSTYNVGDYVIYNNILYKCIANITVPESFDGTHWMRTTVEEIATQIKSDLENDLENYQPKTWTVIGSGDTNTPLNYNISNYSEIAIFINAASASVLEPHYSLTLPSNFISTSNVRFMFEGGVGTANLVYATVSKTQISISVKLANTQQAATFAVIAR